MRIVSVGFIEPEDVAELKNMPAVIMVGTADEVRACGALLYKPVQIPVPKSTQAPGVAPKGDK